MAKMFKAIVENNANYLTRLTIGTIATTEDKKDNTIPSSNFMGK